MRPTSQNLKSFVKESELSVALVAILFFPTVKFAIVQSIPGLYLYNAQANIIITIIISLFLIPTINTIIRRNGLKLVLAFTLFTVFVLVSYLLYPDNRDNINGHLFDIYFVSFISLSISFSIKDYKLLLDYLHKASFVMVISGLFMLIATSIIGAVGTASTEYNMSLSYYMVVPTLTLLLMYHQKRNFVNLLFFGIGFLVIFVMGSRGSLLCIVTFYLLYNLKYRKYTVKRLLLDSTYILGSIFIVLNMAKIYRWLYETLLYLNLNSRTLHYLTIGNITALSNRDIFIDEISRKLLENPIFGIGFLGDLRSHNIILETLLFFGIFVGGMILIILTYLSFKSLVYKSNRELSYLILIFFSYAIPDALLNLTVWGKDMFWIFIGLSINSLVKKARR